MTRRLTLASGSVLAVVLLAGQAIAGWTHRPGHVDAVAVAVVAPAPAAPTTVPPSGAPTTAPPSTTPAAPPAKPPVKPRPVPRGPVSGPDARGVQRLTPGNGVALTFDDGPSPTYTPQILALLRANHVKATFCLIGKEAQAYPQLVQQIVREGHTLCNHSWNHSLNLGSQPVASIRADLVRTNAAIRRAVPGAAIPFFRQPGGNWTPQAVAVTRQLDMTPLGWTVDPTDWQRPSASVITSRVIAGSRKHSIVLMHDGGGDRSNTVAANRVLIPHLKRRLGIVPLR